MQRQARIQTLIAGVVAVLLLVVTACSSDDQNNPPAGDTLPPPGVEAGLPATDGAPAPQDDHGVTPPPPPAEVPGAWINITAGSFTMGSPPSEGCRDVDEAAHQVTLTRSFEIAQTEVTQRQFTKVMGYNPAYNAACGRDCPVEWVNWHEAAAYCNALSQIKKLGACYSCTGNAPGVTCAPTPNLGPYSCKGYRLPTEAEWELAARAGTQTALHNGDITSCMGKCTNATKIAYYKSTSTGVPHLVAQRTPNAWKLHDMSGNVYEWTNDWYKADLGTAAVTDPTGPANGGEKVFRGGAWYYNAEHARSANRERFDPNKRFTFLGFRCVRGL